MKRSATITKQPGAKRFKKSSGVRTILRASTIAAPTRKRVELKRFTDEVLETNSIDPSGSLVRWGGIGEGSGPTQRDGRAVQLKAFEVRGRVQSSTSGNVRVIVGMWHQASSGPPTVNDILDDEGATISRMYAPYSIRQAGGYTVLQDRVYNVTPVTWAEDSFPPNPQYIHLYGKLNTIQTYSAGSGHDTVDNELFCLVITSAISASCEIAGGVTFIDI